MPNPATYVDVEARWRPLSTQERTTATTLLDDVWRDLRRGVPDLTGRLAALPIDQDLQPEAVKILVDAVLRVLKNPDGSKREGADDATWEPNEAAASGLLYLTDAEMDRVRIAPAGNVAAVYVISLGG